MRHKSFSTRVTKLWHAISGGLAGAAQAAGEQSTQPIATKEQYDICKSIYDEEKNRYSALGSRANIYVTLISFFLGAVLFNLGNLKGLLTEFRIPNWVELLMGISLVIALIYAVLSLVYRTDVQIQDLFVIVKEELPTAISNEEFYANRVADLAVATDLNYRLNNRVSNMLLHAEYWLLVAISVEGSAIIGGLLGTNGPLGVVWRKL